MTGEDAGHRIPEFFSTTPCRVRNSNLLPDASAVAFG
jgi:hypothetical protein